MEAAFGPPLRIVLVVFHHPECSNSNDVYVCVRSVVDTESSLKSIDDSNHIHQRESKKIVLQSSTNSIRLELTNFIIQYKLDELPTYSGNGGWGERKWIRKYGW